MVIFLIIIIVTIMVGSETKSRAIGRSRVVDRS
jgi:hypothetical protein